MNCPVCNVPTKGKSGYCLEHWRTVGMPLRVKSDPTVNAKRSERMTRFYMENPDKKAAQRAFLREMGQRPEVKARKAESARERRIWELGNRHLWKGSEPRKLAAKKMSETKLAWCPDYLRDEYRFLTRKKQIRADAARAMILEQHRRIVVSKFGDASDAL